MQKQKDLPKSKAKYSVFIRWHQYYSPSDHRITECKHFGDTYAVSEKKAISNCKFRNDMYHYADIDIPWSGDGGRTAEFKAIEQKEEEKENA